MKYLLAAILTILTIEIGILFGWQLIPYSKMKNISNGVDTVYLLRSSESYASQQSHKCNVSTRTVFINGTPDIHGFNHRLFVNGREIGFVYLDEVK